MTRLPMNISILRFDREVDSEQSTLLVAISNSNVSAIVGSVELLHVRRRAACIRLLFVDPRVRMRAIGRKLIEKCSEISRQSSCVSLGLSLAKGNADAEAFYRRLGFIFAYSFDDGSQILVRLV